MIDYIWLSSERLCCVVEKCTLYEGMWFEFINQEDFEIHFNPDSFIILFLFGQSAIEETSIVCENV